MKHLKKFNENIFSDRGEYIRATLTELVDDIDAELTYSDKGSDEYYKVTYKIPTDGINFTGSMLVPDINKIIEFNNLNNRIAIAFKKALLKLNADNILGLFDITHHHTHYEYDLCAYVKVKEENEVS
jgi:hypothetical protein